MVDGVTRRRTTTNVFNFTFGFPPGTSLPYLLPESYEEALKMLEAKRLLAQA